jgi:hypothetical protein
METAMTTTTTTVNAEDVRLIDANDQPFDPRAPARGGWALIEIMGHRQHRGYVREVQLFGATMCHVLVPFHEGPGVQFAHVYGGSAIFAVTPCSKKRCIEDAPRPFVQRDYSRLLAEGDDDDQDDDDGAEEEGDDVPAPTEKLEDSDR